MKKLSILLIVLCFLFVYTGIALAEGRRADEPEAEEAPAVERALVQEELLDFSDVTIRFDFGGPEGCPFASVLYNGAMAAAQHLGCTVEAIWSDWDPGKEVEHFKETIASRPDGAILIGQPGDEGFGPLVDEALSKGIIVTTICVDLPETRDMQALLCTMQAMRWATRLRSITISEPGTGQWSGVFLESHCVV
jgi:hypothetical protein